MIFGHFLDLVEAEFQPKKAEKNTQLNVLHLNALHIISSRFVNLYKFFTLTNFLFWGFFLHFFKINAISYLYGL